MISATFILNQKAQPVAFRKYRGDIPDNYISRFAARAIYQEDTDMSVLPPVFEIDGVIYAYIQRNNLYYCCATVSDANTFVMIEFLNQLNKVLESYFEKADEETIYSNITIVYELLDEVIDYGYPQTMEPDVLKSFIQQKSLMDKLLEQFLERKKKQVTIAPPAVTGLVSWRKEGISYKKNEAYLDVVETLDLIMTQEGKVLNSTVKGVFKMKSQLSGMPNLKLGLNDKVRFDSALGIQSQETYDMIDLEDVKLHQCVKLPTFEQDRTISFIPPDGSFDLLSYRITTLNRRPTVSCSVQETKTPMGFSYLVKLEANFKAKSISREIVVYVPVPIDADTPEFKPSMGIAKYRPSLQCLEWTIKQMPGKQTAVLTANFGLPSCRVLTEDSTAYSKKPVSIKFDIPYYSLSGINIRYLKIHDKSGYEATPWVRYLASGSITIKR